MTSQLLLLIPLVLRMVMFALALGLTVISFQAYRQKQTQRLEYAFIGFAFISMGTALSTLVTQVEGVTVLLMSAETLPFIIGFSLLYASLYR